MLKNNNDRKAAIVKGIHLTFFTEDLAEKKCNKVRRVYLFSWLKKSEENKNSLMNISIIEIFTGALS